MKIIFTERARRDWRRLDRVVREQLYKKLSFYAKDGQLLRFAEKLKNYSHGEYRFRIGDCRAIFDYSGGTVFVLRVGHRKDIYK